MARRTRNRQPLAYVGRSLTPAERAGLTAAATDGARLFAVDGRTPAERTGARTYWRGQQSAMFDATPNDEEQTDPLACDVCASTLHATERCPHGLALSLDMNQEPHT